jgi:hypothetical protein
MFLFYVLRNKQDELQNLYKILVIKGLVNAFKEHECDRIVGEQAKMTF